MSPTLRLLVIILAGGYILWTLWRRIQAASATSEGEAEEQRAWRDGFTLLAQDASFAKLHAYAQSQATLTKDEPTDGTHRLTHAAVLNELGQPMPLQVLAQGAFLVLYAKGPQGCKQFSLSLKDGVLHTTELNALAYQSVVPGWAVSLPL